MIKAKYKDRDRIVDILVNSFDGNKSVNYIVKQDTKRIQRIRMLMKYSFDTCLLYGDVFLSEDKKGCALIILPDKKRSTLRSVWLDIKLISFGLIQHKKSCQKGSKDQKATTQRIDVLSMVHWCESGSSKRRHRH